MKICLKSLVLIIIAHVTMQAFCAEIAEIDRVNSKMESIKGYGLSWGIACGSAAFGCTRVERGESPASSVVITPLAVCLAFSIKDKYWRERFGTPARLQYKNDKLFNIYFLAGLEWGILTSHMANGIIGISSPEDAAKASMMLLKGGALLGFQILGGSLEEYLEGRQQNAPDLV